MMRAFVIGFWLLGMTADAAVSLTYPVLPPDVTSAIDFNELRGQAKAAVDRLSVAQEQRLALAVR